MQHTMHKLITKSAAYFANIKMHIISQLIIRIYIRFYNISLTECIKKQPSQYKSLAQFFIRKLDLKNRPMAYNKWVSPADGKVILNQKLNDNTTICAKGTGFTPNQLIQSQDDISGYHAMTIYLAPRDYHRFHMPKTATLVAIKEAGGLLRSVDPNNILKHPNLFSENKRVILTFNSPEGTFYMVMVGALIVGEITLTSEQGPLRINAEYKKGEQLGYFTFGSTVIMLTPEALKAALGPIKVRAQLSDQP